ncbi:MAG: threonine/serine exporter family protein [Ruminococcaceae bacterium]|nr:threonine/serine exporter family protein [Oscillospiraceae bacterium]
MEDGKSLDSHISLALDIGMQMLVCGAQISRVEDAIGRICKALGAVETHVFSITSAIIVTAFDDKGNSATQLRRIHAGSYDLTRLQKLNQLSRDICANRVTDTEIPLKLRQIDAQVNRPLWLMALVYALISGSLSIFFGASWTDGICAAGTGIILCFLEYFMRKINLDHVFTVFLVSLLTGLCNAALVKSGLGQRFDAISIGNIMLLIPGIAMTNAVHDMFVDDMLSGVSRFFRSLVIAFLVAFGFTLASTVSKDTVVIDPFYQTVMGALGSVGFALMFQVRGKMLIFAFLGGILSWGTYCIAGLFVGHEALQYLIATTVLTLYAEAFARILRCPSTILLVTGWIPLIPGSMLYYSISALMQDNMPLFVDRILHTFLLMVAMSAGMLLGMTLVHLISPLRPHRGKTKK